MIFSKGKILKVVKEKEMFAELKKLIDKIAKRKKRASCLVGCDSACEILMCSQSPHSQARRCAHKNLYCLRRLTPFVIRLFLPPGESNIQFFSVKIRE